MRTAQDKEASDSQRAGQTHSKNLLRRHHTRCTLSPDRCLQRVSFRDRLHSLPRSVAAGSQLGNPRGGERRTTAAREAAGRGSSIEDSFSSLPLPSVSPARPGWTPRRQSPPDFCCRQAREFTVASNSASASAANAAGSAELIASPPSTHPSTRELAIQQEL
jgi:hypothetical protein